MEWTDADRRQLAARGISRVEAERQIALLAAPPGYARLDRPCTPGDGIERWTASERATRIELARRAARAGRLSSFVPASGAATRMFKELLTWCARPGDLPIAELSAAAAAGAADADSTRTWWTELERFAFWPELSALVRGGDRARGPLRPWLEALLAPGGLGYAERPKGLLAFHRDSAGVRTAFDEQLAEGASLLAPGGGSCAMHFTVSSEHRAAFVARLAAQRGSLESRTGARYAVTFSEQSPATDTLAAEPSGRPFRDAEGALLLRPAGHGALIGNLAESGGDLVFMKNIDNVTLGPRQGETLEWAQALFGRLIELQAEADAHAHAVAAGGVGALAAAEAWLAERFGGTGALAEQVVGERLARPLRVCGMVPNTGEPGGGPFWAHDRSGSVSRQVVESAEVDPGDPVQREQFRRSTHFNPVFMVCALRDRHGAPIDLDRYLDPQAVIIARKSSGGRELLALERPGLWNGAMALWNTVFVEVPLAVFNPVKSVLDLLRPEHQP